MSEPISVPPRVSAVRHPPRRGNLLALQIVGLLVTAIALAAILTFCAKSAPHGPGRPGAPGAGGAPGGRASRGPRGAGGGQGGRAPTTVGIAQARSGSIPIQLSALGSVLPVATVNVNSRVSGQLDRVTFVEGQMVRRGQLLAQIDPRPFQIAVQQARGQLLRDEAALKDAQLDLQRYRTLKNEDSIAAQQVDTQAALVQQDLATVSADRATVASNQLNLSFTHITSPISGRVGLRQIDAGNQIAANSATPVAVVTQIDPINVVFALPEGQIPAVNGRLRSGLAVTAYDRAGGTVLAQGVLATLDNVIDATTGTIKAKARFGNASGALFPSQFVNVVLLVNTLENQIIVPTTAVRHGPKGNYVWVLQPDKTARARPVETGPGTAELVSIASGLVSGETVITDGGDKLRDGGPVALPGQGGGYGVRGGRGGPGGPGGGHHRRGGGGGGAPAG